MTPLLFLLYFYAWVFFKLQKIVNIFWKKKYSSWKSFELKIKGFFWTEMPTFWAKIGEFSDVEKTSGFRVLNVGFRVFFGYYFSGSGRIRVAKMSGFSTGFRVFVYPNTSLWCSKKRQNTSLQLLSKSNLKIPAFYIIIANFSWRRAKF